MFDSYAQRLFDLLPELEDLASDEARRNLSRAYLAILQLRTKTGELGPEATEAVSYLRRLANSLEIHAVLQDDVPSTERQAAAFVAAEALALAAEFQEHVMGRSPEQARIHNPDLFHRLEAALLYLMARYDSNAAGVLSKVPDPEPKQDRFAIAAEWLFDLLRDFCTFRLDPLPDVTPPVSFNVAEELSPQDLEDDTLARLYKRMGVSVVHFMRWLSGVDDDGMNKARRILEELTTALTPVSTNRVIIVPGPEYARIHHLCTLILRAIGETSSRALVHTLPVPEGVSIQDYRSYLNSRATGQDEGGRGRPILWPSAEAYVRGCILGDAQHAVISMPTGSGKSFVAELALSQRLGVGWCLYLVPTNALAHQVRNDLRRALRPLETKVLAFIGDREYTTLESESVDDASPNSVVVMTPEKCLLALRLNPQAFATCGLVVFDECHLMGEASSGRGVTAELVLSQLMLLAPRCRFLLMSAILQNPHDLAAWFQDATNARSVPLTIGWRPTRTLRGALGIDQAGASAAYEQALKELPKLPKTRRYVPFEAPYALVAGLQGAWVSQNYTDYGVVPLPLMAELKLERPNRENKVPPVTADSWVNGSAGSVACFLADRGIQTLVFIPTNKHYPFSIAGKVSLSEETVKTLATKPSLIASYRVLAEFELGVPSEVFSLIDRGISVHTAAMIETEKMAAESTFAQGATRVMFATGTLAQGLNLPAIAVVIAGTRIGDPRGEDVEVVEQRKLAQLLNAAGRAGRAGFANQGFVVAVPDSPLLVSGQTGLHRLRNQLEYLQKADNAVPVGSGLDTFLDNLAYGTLLPSEAGTVELQAISMLAGGDPQAPEPGAVLSRSFAAYRRKVSGREDVSVVAGSNLVKIRQEFIAETGAPEWMTIAAQRSGLDFWLALAISQAWAELQEEVAPQQLSWDIKQWRDFFLKLVSRIPPRLILRHFSLETLKRLNPRVEELLKENLGWETAGERNTPAGYEEAWLKINDLLDPWMNGAPLIEIASLMTGIPVARIQPKRTAGAQPIPKVIALVNDAFSSLATLAGGFVAIAEQLFKDFAKGGNDAFAGGVPRSLSSLPLCIKHGFGHLSGLSWYRFGVRLRRPAHLLSSRYPVPGDLEETSSRVWVLNERRRWLAVQSGAGEDQRDVLEAIRTFLTSSSR